METAHPLHACCRTKLLPGWVDFPLNLLSKKESVKLLLDTGQVEVKNDAASAAAARIAKAAGYLRKPQINRHSRPLKKLLLQLYTYRSWVGWSHSTRDPMIGTQKSSKSCVVIKSVSEEGKTFSLTVDLLVRLQVPLVKDLVIGPWLL